MRWREHRGADSPIDPKADVVIRFRNGRENGPSPASHWRWKAWPDGESEFDIVECGSRTRQIDSVRPDNSIAGPT